MVLTKNSTVRVPVETSGNLGGLYGALGQDPRYFRIVNLEDAAFEFRAVHFQIDGEFVASFQDTINFVSVSLRKKYTGQPAVTRALRFGPEEVKAGKTTQELAFPRLGLTGADWAEYEYQVRWSLRGGPTVTLPKAADEWLRTSDVSVTLRPPFERRVIEIDADRQLFTASGMATAVVEFAALLAGKPRLDHAATLRATDTSSSKTVAVYHDPGTPVAVRVSWHSPSGTSIGKLQVLDGPLLTLTPPSPSPSADGGAR
jgi:hypothetical protein